MYTGAKMGTMGDELTPHGGRTMLTYTMKNWVWSASPLWTGGAWHHQDQQENHVYLHKWSIPQQQPGKVLAAHTWDGVLQGTPLLHLRYPTATTPLNGTPLLWHILEHTQFFILLVHMVLLPWGCQLTTCFPKFGTSVHYTQTGSICLK